MNNPQTYFLTGAQGCIGSWIVKALAECGDMAVVFDQSDNLGRLRAIMDDALLERVQFCQGDITDAGAVREALHASGARRVVHLAGLQTPACQAHPALGAMVNVVGTINVFEAARLAGVERVVYASSAAVFGQSDDGNAASAMALDESAACSPQTHYGVWKQANEGSARVYFAAHGLSSVGLRPLTVYGVGRDTGLTSDPTKAMKAAVLGRPFHIRFGGRTDFQYVADTAAIFLACADRAPAGAHLFNLHGETVSIQEIVGTIHEQMPAEKRHLITFDGPPLPIAPALSDAAIRQALGDLPSTPLQQGVRQTIERFTLLRDENRLDSADLDAA